MTVLIGSLFAGIGGFDLAFEQAGATVAWQVEIDPNAQAVLRHHWPHVPLYDDVRECGAHNLAPVDIITFGSPCQDLSVAGKRAGLDGKRSGLFFEATRIIRELRPALALCENVPGAFSSRRGLDFAAALDALVNSGALDIGWRVLDAQFFGVPQRRRRIFVVADFRAERCGQILFESESMSGNPATSGAAREDIAAGLSGSAGSGRNKGADHETYIVAGTVSAKWAKGTGGPSGDEVQNLVTHALTAEGHDASEDGTGRGTPLVAYDRYASPAQSMNPSGVVPTIKSSHMQPAVGVRRLTPRECERLQGFPDDHTLVPHRPPPPVNKRTRDGSLHRKPRMMTDSARYRLLGNAVAVPVVEWIAGRMLASM